MKKEIESLLETPVTEFRPQTYDSEKIEHVSKLMAKMAESVDLDEYLKIVSSYNAMKKEKQLNIIQIARIAETPELTIRRFENLQSIPNILTLIKILRAVGLTVSTQPISPL